MSKLTWVGHSAVNSICYGACGPGSIMYKIRQEAISGKHHLLHLDRIIGKFKEESEAKVYAQKHFTGENHG